MSVTQPPKDTPFGLDQNIAAGLAYLFGIIGGVVMLLGGGTNKFVRWAAAQSIVLWATFIILWWAVTIIMGALHLWPFFFPVWMVLRILGLVLWLWTFIAAFQNKEVTVPIVGDLTRNIFKSYLQ
ncbi:MAG TPA: hypothetical protein VMU38_00730 [Candidatus Binatia bacterium]|nr:hypothetical protein [Candidatus Binatia bacterium]